MEDEEAHFLRDRLERLRRLLESIDDRLARQAIVDSIAEIEYRLDDLEDHDD